MKLRIRKIYRQAGWLVLLSLYLGACSGRRAPAGGHQAHDHDQQMAQAGETVLPTGQMVISNQATVRPALPGSAIRIPVQGYITYDLRRNNQVAARVGGRIEKLYVRYNNQYVRRGDKIMGLYSPELSTFQEEFRYLVRAETSPLLLQKGREKLRLLGLSQAQVARLERTGQPSASITLYSPYTGYIQLQAGGAPGGMSPGAGTAREASGAMSAMGGGGNTPVYPASGEPIREGTYVNAGQPLFSVNDLQQVWAILSFETRFSALVRENDAVELQSEMAPEQSLSSTVGLLEPIFRQQQKFIQARAYLPNPGRRLAINSLVSGSILPRAQTALVVPASSVLDLGRRKIVWVYRGQTRQGSKRFEARQIQTGAAYGDSIRIIRGLGRHEQIAREAGYLVDSESFIQPTFHPKP